MLNKVILMGRLTRDPDCRITPADIKVSTFTLAVERNTAKNSEKRKVDFINCVAFSHNAAFVGNYFKKGQLVAVAGRIQTRKWDENGTTRYATDVVVEECHFAEPKKQESSNEAVMDDDFNLPYDENLPF